MKQNSPHSRDLRGKNHSGMPLAKADFSGADLRDADFSGANLYKADFTDAELHGAKFTKANLCEANFSRVSVDDTSTKPTVDFNGANLRGTNFTGSILGHADFSNTQAGLSRSWFYFVIFCSAIVSLLSAFPAAVVGTFTVQYFFTPRKLLSYPTLILIGLWSIFLAIAIRTSVFLFLKDPWYIALHVYIGIGLIISVAIIMLLMAIAVGDTKSVIGSFIYWVFVALVPLGLSFFFNYYFQQTELQLAEWFPGIAGTLPDLFPGIRSTANGAWVSGIMGATLGALFGCYFARLALSEDKAFDRLWKFYIWFVTRGGTCFNSADLTSANFTSAWLKGADFQNARIKSVIWHKAQALRYACTGSGYLQLPQIRELVIGGKVASKNFNGFNLEGIHLEGKDLSNAQFVNTNLSQANLQNTNLTQANLKHAQLSGANLGKSCLTGAIIEKWIIDEATNFTEVKCNFVFKKVIEDHVTGIHERMQRVPAQGNFRDGDFENIIKIEPGIVDLIIYGNSIPQAVEAAFEKLMRDTKYEFQGFERKGKDFLVKICVLDKTEMDDVRAEYDDAYREAEKNISHYPKSQEPRDLRDVIFKAIKVEKEALRDLRNILVELYPDEPSIRRVIDDCGIGLSRIILTSSPTNSWHSILAEASKINQVDTLLRVVEREYGRNEEFQKACDNYRQSI